MTDSSENRLAQTSSPYLLQHKNNPVDWWPWCPQALDEAKRLNKPILLSIGYAACHWCHVMAHESFEDDRTAAVMNRLFVNIKVDREERPDIDQIYMTALHHLGERGGWPLTMFLTPKGEPIWGGTYFPNVSRYGRPGFTDILEEVARLYRDEPQRIEHNRTALMQALATKARSQHNAALGPADLDAASAAIARAFDHTHGGFGRAPKFPQCSILELLWRTGMRRDDERFYNLVELTLAHMSEGEIYDHLGGGFSRYAVDEKWLVPHFEKMLYDNAQLLELLGLAYVRTGRTLYRNRAEDTVQWLVREMTTPAGAFCASLDADSDGEEGKFYVWSPAEIEAVLGASDAALFRTAYDVTVAGNFEGHNILNRLHVLQGTFDVSQSTDSADDDDRLAPLRAKLLAARNTRVRPGLDDKVLADWNGLMIAALANTGAMLSKPAWIDMARRAFAFIVGHMTQDDRLAHASRDNNLLFPGFASDFTFMIKAAIALYEATGVIDYLAHAVRWQIAFERHYINRTNGGYFFTAADAEGLIVRPESTTDEAIPNYHGIAAQNLVRLAILTGDDIWRQRADILFDGLLPAAAESLLVHASLANALDLRLRAIEIVAVGPQADRFAETAQTLPFLDRVLLRANSTEHLPPKHPVRTASLSADQTAAFVCAGEKCSLPVIDSNLLGAAVAAARVNAGTM